jgi:hypothetical protein
VLLIVVSFFASFIIVTGCMKSPKTEIDYGPEYRESEIFAAVKLSKGENSPLEIRLNEFSLTDLTRVIRGRAIVDLLDTVGLSIVRREETSQQFQINMVQERVTYDLSEAHNHKKLIREHQMCMNRSTFRTEACEIESKPVETAIPIATETPIATAIPIETETPIVTATPVPSLEPTPVALLSDDEIVANSLKLFPQMSQYEDDEPRVSYHQLKVTERITPPPKAVQDSANCGGIPNCLIKVTDIEFDQVNWLTYNKGDKIHVKITTSKDVPYLSRILEKCQQGSVPIKQEGKPEKDWPRLLVTFCETVRNFQKGE